MQKKLVLPHGNTSFFLLCYVVLNGFSRRELCLTSCFVGAAQGLLTVPEL